MFNWIKNLFKNKKQSFKDEEDGIFDKESFVFPFDSPEGVIHEIYSIRKSGQCGYFSIDEKDENFNRTGTIFTVRAEIEVPQENIFLDVCEYMRKNPHIKTKRVIKDIWMTDDELIKNLKSTNNE